MKKPIQKSLGISLVAVCVLCGSSQAKADIDTIRNSNSEIWGSAGTSLLNYNEDISTPNIPDSEHGWTPSLAVGVDYMGSRNLYFALEGSVAFGNDNYNGSLYDQNTGNYDIPYQSTTHETITNVDGKFGKGFALSNIVMLTPYVELGFRYWERNLGGGDVEDYQNFDTLGGLMFQIAPTNRLILTAYGSAGTTFAASMKANVTGDTYDLGSAGMYKVGGKIGYDLTQRLELFTTLDYDAFRYGQSPLQADGTLEPSSHTEDTTLRVGLGYHFR